MNYAIIRTGSKQYQAIVGKTLKIEKLATTEGSVVFDDVLLHVDGDKVEVGTPTLANLKVYATALGVEKAAKIQVFKYKSKSRYRKLRGHRQTYSLVKIESIGTAPAAKAAKPKAKAVTPKPAKRTVKKPAKKTAK